MANQTLTHRARLENCLSDGFLDRPPVALWRHFPVDDQTPDGLAAATAGFQHLFDFDLIKVTPSSSFCLKDWGAQDHWKGNPEGTRDYKGHVIKTADDWEHLTILEPKKGYLGAQLTSLQILVGEFSKDTPVLQTIFSPLAQAKNLVGPEQLLVHLRSSPDSLHAGLKIITETTIRFIEKASVTGISGIFYAIQHAQFGSLSLQEYENFGKVYDLQVLAATQNMWLNLLHLHGENIMFDLVANYPVSIINWHDRQTSPNLAEALARSERVVCGGLRQWETLALGTPEEVRAEARGAISATGGKRFILGTGCVMPIIAPVCNIFAARRAVDEISRRDR